MNKSEKFDDHLQELARFAKVISHPARLSILKYLAETKTCISGDISDYLPLSRTSVSQHLKELRDLGLIHGQIDGLKINYCLCSNEIARFIESFDSFFEKIKAADISCGTTKWIVRDENINEFAKEDWDYVITVCDMAKESGPAFLGNVKNSVYLKFEDPLAYEGDNEFHLKLIRTTRTEIVSVFEDFYNEFIASK